MEKDKIPDENYYNDDFTLNPNHWLNKIDWIAMSRDAKEIRDKIIAEKLGLTPKDESNNQSPEPEYNKP